MAARLRIGLDIGGTVTDLVLADPRTGGLRLHNRLTTPEDPAAGALDSLAAIVSAHGVGLSDIGEIVHGTRQGGRNGRWACCSRPAC